LLEVNPSRDSLLKIVALQDLIRKGLSLRESIRRVGLGWKRLDKRDSNSSYWAEAQRTEVENFLMQISYIMWGC
jgi:hypothetical protein